MSTKTKRLVVRVIGIAIFAIGLMLANRTSPEWATRGTASTDEAKAQFDTVAAGLGYEPTVTRRKTELKLGPSASDISIRREAANRFGDRSVEWLIDRGMGLIATVEAPVTHESGRAGLLDISSDMKGNVVAIEFTTNTFRNFINPGPTAVDPDLYVGQAEQMLRPGESLGDVRFATLGAQKLSIFPIIGSELPELISVVEPPGIQLANRRPGTPESIQTFYDELLSPKHMLLRGLTVLLRVGIIVFFGALFIVLIVRRSIGFRTGLMLATLVLITSTAGALDEVGPAWMLTMRIGISFLIAGWCVVVWSASESWLRTVKPNALQTIDTIASFRPGPRSANAILDGWFGGLGLAGLLLLIEVLSAEFGLLSVSSAALDLPVFGTSNPLSGALLLAGPILAASAASHYFTGRSEALVGIGLMALMIFPSLRLPHWTLGLLAALFLSVSLRWILLHGGGAAVLSATLTMLSVPAAVFALRHLDWMPYSALGASALVFLPLLFAMIGLQKPADQETQQIVVPRFMRRLSEERRVQYEMGLLAEMQVRMLPDSSPAVEGWDIAASSVLASEVGGDLYDYLEDENGNLWIAIGDVSGHGYQCAIAQAMTKASLTSLVSAEHSPSELLARIDKVLRRGGSARTFTSLALAKIELASGNVTLSNAGNPYPVHVTVDGRTHEIELPSLPLGMGPPRTYDDVHIHLAERDYLLFYSDGLVEVRNRDDVMLGFEKPGAIVRMRRGQPSAEIVTGLEKAWRDHLGEEDIQDDTTIVLIRRA